MGHKFGRNILGDHVNNVHNRGVNGIFRGQRPGARVFSSQTTITNNTESETSTPMTIPHQTTPLEYTNPELDEHRQNQPGSRVHLKYGLGPIPQELRNSRVFLFDIDNCLYQRSTRIHDMMQEKIHQYFKHHLQLSDDQAQELHLSYYKTYGLALEGLVRNHSVDALEYNSEVDDSLDLKAVLSYNELLRDMLKAIRQSGQFDVLWLITNAYKNHALRVVSFLGVGDLFDGLTFCDYAESPIVCKPMKQFFDRCLHVINVDGNDANAKGRLSFVDDSELNVKAAFDQGFGHVFHYVEDEAEVSTLRLKPDFAAYYGKNKITIVTDMLDLPAVIQN